MHSALVEKGFPVRGRKVIQPLQFKFSKKLKNVVRKELQNAKYDIARATIMPVPTNYRKCLKRMIRFWAKQYDFREQEKVFNKFPHFRITIDEIDIHYVHVKPVTSLEGKKTVCPLLMLHGWPSSVIEFYDTIPFLTDTSNMHRVNIVFEVIIPSLPGFGGSSCPTYQNLNWHYMAELLVKFMTELHFKKFYVHCDDWCVFIVHEMTQKFPKKLMGVHYGLCQVEGMTDLETYLAERFAKCCVIRAEEKKLKNGYYDSPASLCHNTHGMGLMSSPTALIAYVFEKFVKDSIHSDTIDTIEEYKRVTFINNVMMYWVTRSVLSSSKAYRACTVNGYLYTSNLVVNRNVFTAITMFLPSSVKVVRIVPRRNLSVSWKFKNTSFRFPAIEAPELFAENISRHFADQWNTDDD